MAEYFDLDKTGSEVQTRINTLQYNGDGTKVLDNTGVYSLVNDNKIGNRTIQEPEANTGTATGFLTVLLNKLTAAIRALRISVSNHTSRTDNPHLITKSQAGLGNVDNIKQASKTEFDSHNNDNEIHVTPEDKTNWNGKADITYVDDKIENAEIKLDNAVGITVDNEDLKVTGAVLVAGEDGDYYFDETGKGNKLLCYSKQGAFLHDLGYGKQDADNRFANAVVGKASGKTLTLSDVQSGTDFSKVKILGEATEIGTGEKSPDNPYTLVGVENTTVTVSGKNIFSSNWEIGAISSTGENISGTMYARTDFIELPMNDVYTVSFELEGYSSISDCVVYYYDEDKTFLSHVAGNYNVIKYTFTPPLTAKFVRFRTFRSNGQGIIPVTSMLVLGSTATLYEPYKPILRYPVTTPPLYSLPDGTKDSVDLSGLMTNNIGIATLGAGTTWTIPEAVNNSPIICTISSIANLTGKTLAISEGVTESFTVLYKLATPTTAQLTPIAIPAYSPTTIISTDKGSLDVEYNRDINKVLDGLYAAITALGGSI